MGHQKSRGIGRRKTIIFQFPLGDLHSLARGHGNARSSAGIVSPERFDQGNGGKHFPYGKSVDPDGLFLPVCRRVETAGAFG
jgi:hypothetical protein